VQISFSRKHLRFLPQKKTSIPKKRDQGRIGGATLVDGKIRPLKLVNAKYAAFSLRNLRGRFKKACQGLHLPPIFWGQGTFLLFSITVFISYYHKPKRNVLSRG
jgi:hypothetical protein